MFSKAGGQVDLFFLDLESLSPANSEAYSSLLSPEELKRLGELGSPLAKKQFSMSRGFLRKKVGVALSRNPKEISFLTGPFGKPFIKENPVFFNLSHHKNQLLLALTKVGEVGVDIESFSRKKSFEKIARRFFAAEEVAHLEVGKKWSGLDFFCFWVLKESALKANGEGIQAKLKNAVFKLPRCGFEFTNRMDGEKYRFYLACFKEYVFALSLRSHSDKDRLVIYSDEPLKTLHSDFHSVEFIRTNI